MSARLTAVTRPKLGRATTEELGRRIVTGQLQPGDQLPTEATLCIELGVSRTTIRESIKRLHAKGLLDGGPRTGMRVLPTTAWNQLDADVLLWRTRDGLDAELADQLYEVRTCVEPEACRMAATRATAAERDAIAEQFALLASEDGDVAAHVAADIAFHLAIFRATHNPFLITLGTAIRTGLELAFRQSQERARMSETELELHRRIAGAIAAGRAAQAATAMTRLIEESRRSLIR